jgi:hypothetical protein
LSQGIGVGRRALKAPQTLTDGLTCEPFFEIFARNNASPSASASNFSVLTSDFSLLQVRVPVLEQRDWSSGFVQDRVYEEATVAGDVVLSAQC